MNAPACPAVDDLKQYRLGRLPEMRSTQVEQHVSGCPACLEKLPGVGLDDPLVAGLRQQRGRPRLNNPLLDGIRRDAKAKPFRPRAAEYPTPANQHDDATMAAPPSLERDDGLPSFVAPPRGPGEIGWLGPYRVLRILGQGGMGMVLQAEDTKLQRNVALKVMKPMLAAEASARQRFLREARATAALTHDHIVAIHHIDEAQGVPFLAMPLLLGETLEDRLKREGLLSLHEMIRVARETAEGLAAAHEKGLIHRDIKPGNLWLESPSGRVKILDFGLASMPCPEGEKTLPGTILGTPGYMAPEQTEGETDHRSDLFSLGCVMYRMATGQVPFRGDNMMQKIRSTLFDMPKPPQEINAVLPPALCQLILRLLSRKPEDRPATALAVSRVLATLETQLLRGGSAPLAHLIGTAMPSLREDTEAVPMAVPATPVAPTPPPTQVFAPSPRWRFDRRWLMPAGGVAAALLLAIVIIVASSGKKKEDDDSRVDARKDGDASKDREGEGSNYRPFAKPLVKPAPDTTGSSTDLPRDRTFPETWVLKPQPIEGLKGWTIETNYVGKPYPEDLSLLNDERLLVRYSGRWSVFDPKTLGLLPAPFGGSYSAVRGDGRMCARSVSGGVELWEEGGSKAWITLRTGGYPNSAAFSPDGQLILTSILAPGGASDNFWIHDAREGSRITNFSCEAVAPYPTCWSPDGKSIALPTRGTNGLLLFRSPWTMQPKKIARPSAVTSGAWSPDSKFLATVEGGNRIHILNVEQENEVVDISEPKAISVLPAWWPDGSALAFCTEEKKVVVWDVKKKKLIYTFTGHTRGLTAVAFLGDGRTLVSASSGSLRFWDLKQDRLRGSLLNLGGSEWVAIDPEGYYRSSPNAEAYFVIKVREMSNRLREFNPPTEFSTVYGWKNRPERVKLTGE